MKRRSGCGERRDDAKNVKAEARAGHVSFVMAGRGGYKIATGPRGLTPYHGTGFSRAANRRKPARDVYMLFGPNASWPATGVPTPAWWEHQLSGLPPELRLDPRRFAAKARALERDPR